MITKVKLTFTQELLGTAPGNPELFSEFVATKREDGPAADEQEAVESAADDLDVPEEIAKQSTIFAVNPQGEPILFDYQIKGFFKEACYALRQIPGSADKKLTAYKKKINLLTLVEPRFLPLTLPEGQDLQWCERPLRAQTPKGERVALARSQMAPIGSTVSFSVDTLDDSLMPFIEGWLDYGRRSGLGQWRSGGYGRFTWAEEDA